MAGFQFNSAQHNPSSSFDPLPAGWYVAQVTSSEIKPTKSPGGARLNLQFKILNAPAAGRVIFGGYNVKNDNPVAVEIAMNELAALSNAVNTPVWNDSEQLHGKPFHLKLKIVKDTTGQYEDKNEPCGYKNITEAVKLVEQLATGPAAVPQNMGGMGQGLPAGGPGNSGVLPTANKGFGAPAPGTQGGANQQPQGGFQQPQQQAQQQQQSVKPNWGQQQPQGVQTQQVQQEQPVQQAQPQQGGENYQSAATSQPWNQQQPQEQQLSPTQEPVQQQQPVVQQQPQPQQDWSQQQIQPGQQQQAQPLVQQQQPQDQPVDNIAEQAQAEVPPWKRGVVQ